MLILLGASMACAAAAACYLLAIGLDGHRQRDRYTRVCGWLIAAWVIALIQAVTLIGGRP